MMVIYDCLLIKTTHRCTKTTSASDVAPMTNTMGRPLSFKSPCFVPGRWCELLLTGHSQGHQGSNLPLEAVGSDAGVVAGVAPCDFGEVQLAVLLLHMRRQLSSVCRGRQRDTHKEKGGSVGPWQKLHVEVQFKQLYRG